jgi:hypothetical protein
MRRSFLSGMAPADWPSFLQELPASTAAFLSEDPDPQAWIPFGVVQEARDAFSRRMGADPAPVRGEMMAAHILAFGQSQGLFGTQTPMAFLRDYPQLWGELHRGGEAQVEALEARSACLAIRARFPYRDYPESFLPAFFKKLIQHAGGRLVKVQLVDIPPPGFGYRYRLSWM